MSVCESTVNVRTAHKTLTDTAESESEAACMFLWAIAFNAYLVLHRISSFHSKFIHEKMGTQRTHTHSLIHTSSSAHFAQYIENTENFCNKLNRLFEVSNENKLLKHSIEIEVKQKQVIF